MCCLTNLAPSVPLPLRGSFPPRSTNSTLRCTPPEFSLPVRGVCFSWRFTSEDSGSKVSSRMRAALNATTNAQRRRTRRDAHLMLFEKRDGLPPWRDDFTEAERVAYFYAAR